MSVIEENRHVMFRLPSGNFKVVKLVKGQTVNLGKFGTFKVNDILGKPFGFTYEIGENKQLQIVKEDYKLDEGDEEVTELLPHENNRELVDDPSVQNLAMSDIEALKKQGLAGQEIIDKVKAAHSAFDKKTQFSQEKYIKRKKEKFLQQFTPEPLTSTELIDIYLEKDSSRVQNISVETLALMLSYANVQPGGTYLVVDDLSGLLVAAILERIGDEGLIVVAHENEHPNLDGLKYMDLTEAQNSQIKTINWLDFMCPEEYEGFEEKAEADLEELKSSARGQYYRRRQRHADYLQIRELIDGSKFDAVLTGTTLNLTNLIPRLIPAVGGSCPIVAYSEFKEQLLNLTHVLQKDLRIVAPTIMETRVRKYQTLPGRMHPHMTTRGHGGYMLWGTRVVPAKGIEAVGINARKKRKV